MNKTVLLALDLSTEFCSVALAVIDPNHPNDNDAMALERACHVPHPHERLFFRHDATGAMSSAHVLPAVREVFAEARHALRDCTAIALGVGPGSFTGLRTAAGIVQGLAFALQLPVVLVSTLMACAQAARAHDATVTRVLAALDAHMNEVYWALFDWDEQAADWRTVQTALLTAPEAVSAPSNVPFTLAGNAAAVFGARLKATAHATSVDGLALPHAVPIVALGWRSLRAGRIVSAQSALPEYIRNQVALTTAQRNAMVMVQRSAIQRQ